MLGLFRIGFLDISVCGVRGIVERRDRSREKRVFSYACSFVRRWVSFFVREWRFSGL